LAFSTMYTLSEQQAFHKACLFFNPISKCHWALKFTITCSRIETIFRWA